MVDKNAAAFLEKIELFRGLDTDEFKFIVKSVKKKTYRPGDLLFKEKGPREDIYIIYKGEVELFKHSAYGEELKLTCFGKGDFLGEGSWANESPHSTSARALTAATVYSVGKDVFTVNAAATFKIFSNITRIVSRRMRHANSRLLNPASQYVSGRTRIEHDLLGDRDVPFESYYGVQTLRGIENFNISGVTLNFFPLLIDALAMVKEAAAETNFDLKLINRPVRDAIIRHVMRLKTAGFTITLLWI